MFRGRAKLHAYSSNQRLNKKIKMLKYTSGAKKIVQVQISGQVLDTGTILYSKGLSTLFPSKLFFTEIEILQPILKFRSAALFICFRQTNAPASVIFLHNQLQSISDNFLLWYSELCCEVQKFVEKFKSSFHNSQAGLQTKAVIGPWTQRSQSNA